MVQIIILAGIAVFLVLQLRRVLGTRDGFEPDTDAEPRPQRRAPSDGRDFEVIDGGGIDHDIADHVPLDSDAGQALAAMKRVEPHFNVTEFIGGARGAYEMILMGFESGDIAEVRDFLSEDVYESFQGAIDARADQGLQIDASFIGLREVKLREASFDPDSSEATVTVKFVGELTSVVRNLDGEIIEGDPAAIKRQQDIWTFARTMGSDDPNWALVATGG